MNIAQEILAANDQEDYIQFASDVRDECCDKAIAPVDSHITPGTDHEEERTVSTFTFEDSSTITITYDENGIDMQASD